MSNDYIEKCAEDMLEAENAEPGCPPLPLTSYHTFIFFAVICRERSQSVKPIKGKKPALHNRKTLTKLEVFVSPQGLVLMHLDHFKKEYSPATRPKQLYFYCSGV